MHVLNLPFLMVQQNMVIVMNEQPLYCVVLLSRLALGGLLD